MDGSRFDAVSRALVAGQSRRGLTRLLSGLVLSGALALGERREGAAKRKGKKHRKPRRGEASPACPAGQKLCRRSCLSTLVCCADTDCAGGRTCQSGTCACPPNKPHVCSGSTICQECCTVEDCGPSSTARTALLCQGGRCLCKDAAQHICPGGTRQAGWCNAACCDDDECPEARTCEVNVSFGYVQCRCEQTTCADDGAQFLCVPFDCGGTCLARCPQGVAVGQPCCSGKGALVCQPEFDGDTRGRCLP